MLQVEFSLCKHCSVRPLSTSSSALACVFAVVSIFPLSTDFAIARVNYRQVGYIAIY